MGSDEDNRRTIISRANRMLRQRKTLPKLSDELLKESKDLRVAAKDTKRNNSRRGARKKRSSS
jgi:hypothetical protein